MYPRLIDISTGIRGIDHLILPSYFACVTIGFVLAALLIRRWARRHGIDPGLMTDFVIWMAFFGLIGARVLHVVADGHLQDYVNVCRNPALVDWKVDARECAELRGVWDKMRKVCHPAERNCLAMFDITAGGFAFYGGFAAAGLFSAYFIRKHRLPAGKLVDLSSWLLMLGLAWGRIGCFLASCCFGARTDSALGVAFPPGSAASRHHWQEGWLPTYRTASLPVYPTQLIEAGAALLIAALAYYVVRPRKRFDGQVFCAVSLCYAVFRFSIEFIRRDERGAVLGLSTSQIGAVVFAGATLWLWIFFKNRSRNRPSADG